jgi:uncharacterized protein DUF4350
MIQQVKTAYMYLIVMGIGITLVILSIMVPVVSSDADFSLYNTEWNGCSKFGYGIYNTGSFVPTVDISGSSQKSIQHETLDKLDGDITPKDSCIIIIGPQTDFIDSKDENEVGFLDDFLRSGGIVLLADDFGSGNELLKRLNTTTRISKTPMLDLAFMENPNYPVIEEMSDHPITKDVSMLILNIPSTITPSRKAEPIFNSSSNSWLDVNGNIEKDEEEPFGPFPIMTVERYGRGELIVLSEPSLLINNMYKKNRSDDTIFVQNLIDYLTEGRNATIIDEAHRDINDPVSITNQFVSYIDDPYKKIGVLITISVIFIILNTSYPRRSLEGVRRIIERLLAERPEKKDGRSPLEITMEKHPDWDRRVLERIVNDIEGSP